MLSSLTVEAPWAHAKRMSGLNAPSTHGTAPRLRDIALLVACLLIVYCAMVIGAIASVDAADFYNHLARPSWAPAPWIFGPVWTVLYTLMALALWRVWRSVGARGAATGLFLLQLAVNALWSWLFFRWHLGALAFGWIVLLLALIVATITAFARINRRAAVLLVPYGAWVAFAAVLNWSIWQLNPSLLR